MSKLAYGIATVMLLFACAPSTPASLSTPILVDSNLGGTLTVDRGEGHVGEAVRITFTLVNSGRVNTGKPAVLVSNTKSVMDIFVEYTGIEYARWSAQQPTEAIPYRLELQPGDSYTIQLVWVPDERARHKEIVISGEVNWPENHPASEGVTVVV